MGGIDTIFKLPFPVSRLHSLAVKLCMDEQVSFL